MGDRTVGALLIGLGLAVSGVTLAVGEGLITGVRAAWPAHLVGGVLVVIGLVNLRGSGRPPPAETGPIRESGLDPRSPGGHPTGRGMPGGVEGWEQPRDGGGGEPNGRD